MPAPEIGLELDQALNQFLEAVAEGVESVKECWSAPRELLWLFCKSPWISHQLVLQCSQSHWLTQTVPQPVFYKQHFISVYISFVLRLMPNALLSDSIEHLKKPTVKINDLSEINKNCYDARNCKLARSRNN